MVLIPQCITVLLIPQGGCLAHFVSRLLTVGTSIHRIICPMPIWSFSFLINIYVIHITFVLLVCIYTIWLGMTSIHTSINSIIEKKVWSGSWFFRFQHYILYDSGVLSLGWKVSSSGFVSFQPLSKKPLGEENNNTKPNSYEQIH